MRFKIVSLLGLLAACASGQNVSSTINANINDPTGAAVPSAKCELVNAATTAVRRAETTTDGVCTFAAVLPGNYTLRVTAAGFSTYEMKEIAVSASETRSIPNVVLQIGTTQESVQVTAEAAAVQTQSAERAGLVTGNQLQNIALRGRDFFALLNTIPGVVDTSAVRRETTSPESIQGTFINGMRDNQKNFTADGISSIDTGSNQTVHFQPNMDAIAEVRVLTSNYQAEFGRNAGGIVSVISKGGTSQFHGSAYNYYRHETLNANNFFNNRSNTPRAPYRYRMTGYSLGGPIYIPKLVNRNRDKLFFFWSQEFTRMRKDYGVRFANVPTEAQRNGDFSQAFDPNGKLINIIDPQTRAPFLGNIIPKSRIDSVGQSILNYFPTPNYVDSDPRQVHQRNYRAQYSGQYPRRQDMIRADYNVSDSLRVFYRYIQDSDRQTTPWGLTGSTNFSAAPIEFGQPGHGHVFHVTNSFTPTVINETIFGKSYNKVYFDAVDPQAFDRARIGNPPQWYPDEASVATLNYLPNITFGNPPVNAVTVAPFHPPYVNYNDIYSVVNNTSKIAGPHTLRAGLYLEKTKKFAPNWANYRGAYSFAVDANNPNNSGHGFSNALLGNYTSYSEATERLLLNLWFTNFEFFVQDNWRVSKRLTLDFGVRFYYMPNVYDEGNQLAVFDPGAYDPSKAVALYYPHTEGGRLMARDPRTGTLTNSVLIGRIVPDSGNVANGMRVAGENGLPRGLMENPPVKLAPRFGFAYDVFGDGKMAVRGGFGVFYDRPQGQPWVDTSGQPPVAYTPASFYGSLSNIGTGGVLAPSAVVNVIGKGVLPTTMTFSLGAQRQLWNSTLDVSYVGSQSRHLMALRNMNPIPMFARFDPRNQNPTAAPGVSLADNYLRPYAGYGDITLRDFSATSNYNSLQVA
ncbi:MAG TPA: TonB-dependent receptor, partial [Bryobacteraceae bacterium]|nr:TonB-dependent receptor [Bryobacteraceae bacterium]